MEATMWLPLVFLSNFLLQIIAAESKLSSRVNPNDDILLSDNTALSVYMPRKHRQTVSDNDVPTNVVQINKLDINCDLPKDRITVTVEFLQPFNGIIYSKGYRDDPACKVFYFGKSLNSGSGQTTFTFSIPTNACGTRHVKCKQHNCGFGSPIENILIIQQDDFITKINDLARRVTCFTKSPSVTTLSFKPIMVDMLDVVSIPAGDETIECWMDIQRGQYPNLIPVEDIVKIGEPLTVFIAIVDHSNIYDARIHECWAYDSEDYYSKNTKKVLLTDGNGCPKKKNLISFWSRKREPGRQGVKITAYNTLTAFKFSDSDKVFLTCNIELCKGGCAEQCGEEMTSTFGNASAQSTPILPGRFDCYPGSNDARCISTVITTTSTEPFDENEGRVPTASTSTPINLTCYPGSPNLQCYTSVTSFQPTEGYLPSSKPSEKPLKCYFGSTDPRCPKVPQPSKSSITFSTLPVRCYLGSSDPGCPTFPTSPSVAPPTSFLPSPPPSDKPPLSLPPLESACYPGSSNPRCPPFSPTTTSPKSTCFPGSNDFQCQKPHTITPEYLPPPSTLKPLVCYPGFTDSRCAQLFQSSSTLPPSTPPSLLPPNQICYPGSKLFSCPHILSEPPPTVSLPALIPSTSLKPVCYPGSNDIRCPKLKPITPEYIPPSSSPKPPICNPGSFDLRCSQSYPSSPLPASSLPPPSLPSKPICYPGSKDFRCIQVPSQRPPPSQPYSPSSFITSTSSKPICYSSSNDIRCLKLKPITPEYFPPALTKLPICFPGSPDPNCPASFPPPIPSPSKPICYIGSLDSRCPQPFPQSSPPPSAPPPYLSPKPVCYPGSHDIRCSQIPSPSPPLPVYPSTPSPPPLLPFSPEPSFPTVKLICHPGSSDPKCAPSKYPPSEYIPSSNTLKPSRPPFCYPGSNDPRCEKRRPPTPGYLPPVSSTIKPSCLPGSNNPACRGSTLKTLSPILPSSTPKPENYFPSLPSLCYPGSNHPRCSKPESPSPSPTLCYGGSTDSRCLKPLPTATLKPFTIVPSYPPICYPGSPDLRCPHLDPTPLPFCFSGSSDPRCSKPLPTTTPKPVTPIPSFSSICNLGSPHLRCNPPVLYPLHQSICYPGSTDSRCSKIPALTLTPAYPKPTSLSAPLCFSGSADPRCPRPSSPLPYLGPNCFPGSTDIKCLKLPSSSSPTLYPIAGTTPISICYPGAKDSSCTPSSSSSLPPLLPSPTPVPPTETPVVIPTVLPICYPASTDPRCPAKKLTPSCYPGSPDSRCPQPDRPANPKPPIGYLPPDNSAERSQPPGELLKRHSTDQRQIVLQALNNLKKEVRSEVNENEDVVSLNQLVDDLYYELQKENASPSTKPFNS